MNNLINYHFVCECVCVELEIKGRKGFDESSELFPFLPVIWCRTNRRWSRTDERHFRTSVSVRLVQRENGRKIKVVTVCAHSVPRHAEWFIWNKQNPQRTENIAERCRIRLYMLCTLSVLT